MGEFDTGWERPSEALAAAREIVARAAAAGARLVALPEMSTTGFTMSSERFAESVEGPSVNALRDMAAAQGVWIAAGVATREQLSGDATPKGYNSLLVIAPDGEIDAHYRKQRLFACGGEHAAYSPGAEPVISVIDGVRTALFICFDLRFPELFRRVAKESDLMLLVANWPAARQAHWEALLRVRAIENQAYVIGVNRTGDAGGIRYAGGSLAFDPWGDALDSGTGVVDVNPERVRRVREEWPFLESM
jgi:predicted amidohydrolase